jgi:hypothetical protein
MQFIIRFNIPQYGTSLPNADPNKEERSQELEVMRSLYQFGQTAPDLPVQVSAQTCFENGKNDDELKIPEAILQKCSTNKISTGTKFIKSLELRCKW